MLRSQLMLAGLLFTLAVGLGAIASVSLLERLGLPTVAGAVSSVALVSARVLELFIDPAKAHPSPGLALALGAWQVAAVGLLLAPSLPAMPVDLASVIHAPAMALAVLAAMASELGLRFASCLLRPSVHEALRADLAIAEWFARRRLDAERQLLDRMSRDAAVDARLTHRLAQLRRRFEMSETNHP